MIFSTELVVDRQDCDFSTCNNQDNVDNQSKTKDIVELVHPETGHDKEELHIGSSKGNDTSQGHSNHGVQKRRWWGDGPCNSRGDSWELDSIRFVTKVGTQKGKRNRDTTPHCGNYDDIQERSRRYRVHEGQDNVEEKKEPPMEEDPEKHFRSAKEVS